MSSESETPSFSCLSSLDEGENEIKSYCNENKIPLISEI